jgi:hypothetical protein
MRLLLSAGVVCVLALAFASSGVGQTKPDYRSWEQTGVSIAKSSIPGYSGMYFDKQQQLHILVKSNLSGNSISMLSPEYLTKVGLSV